MDALGVAGDVTSAGAALAGLLLVFMGNSAASYSAYDRQARNAVKSKFQLQIWIAFSGFALAIVATGMALWAKAHVSWPAAYTAICLLFVSFGLVVALALNTAREIK